MRAAFSEAPPLYGMLQIKKAYFIYFTLPIDLDFSLLLKVQIKKLDHAKVRAR